MKVIPLLTLIILGIVMSCESNLNKDKSDNVNFAPKLSASDIGKDIPEKFEVYRLLPVNFDHDPVIEYLAIIRPKPDLNSVVEPIGNAYINLYNYDECIFRSH